MRAKLGAIELVELGRRRKLLPKPKKGALGKWLKESSVESRHKALKKVVNKRGCRKVISSLTLLRNLTQDPGTKKLAKQDAKWIRGQGFCKLKTK